MNFSFSAKIISDEERLHYRSGIPKSIGVTFNPHAAVTFELGGKEVKNVNLGDSVTMVIKSDNVQEVKVLNCTASEGTKNTLMFFPANKPSTSIVVSETDGNPAKVEFEAFRFISQKNDELTIKCDVALCPEKANCKLPNPSSPVLYEVAPGVKRKNFEGVLAVYLPQDPMVNTAVKVSSYAKGLLLTLGAVFLQRQLV